MKKVIVVLTLAAATVAFSPRPVAAQEADCTREYMACLNDSYDLDGWLQKLADLECFAEYTGCVAKSIIQE